MIAYLALIAAYALIWLGVALSWLSAPFVYAGGWCSHKGSRLRAWAERRMWSGR